MNTAQPIKKISDLEKLKSYYSEVSYHPRNHLLIVLGLNTALRISDILNLRWCSVYDFETANYKTHIFLIEQKTGKQSLIYLNNNILKTLQEYEQYLHSKKQLPTPEQFLFCHSNRNEPITRVQAFRIIKQAAQYYHLPGVISCHSLRKTFGYHAWKQGVPPALLVSIYNHSSYQTTKRYLGIEQDDRDQIFMQINL